MDLIQTGIVSKLYCNKTLILMNLDQLKQDICMDMHLICVLVSKIPVHENTIRSNEHAF